MSGDERVDTLYALVDEMRAPCGGHRLLADCTGRSGWPERGVYFFFEPGETRTDSVTPRIVRIGTHALKRRSRTSLWQRLSQHRGNPGGRHPGGGNHRGSIFRNHVGMALLNREPRRYPPAVRGYWERRREVTPEIRAAEYTLEQDVSRYIGRMPFLWVEVPDDPGPASLRRHVEANTVALLSNCRRPLDPPSTEWLGGSSARPAIRESGLWNVNHVDDSFEPQALAALRNFVRAGYGP